MCKISLTCAFMIYGLVGVDWQCFNGGVGNGHLNYAKLDELGTLNYP